MRKLLLATVAGLVMTSGLFGVANAQTAATVAAVVPANVPPKPDPAPGQLVVNLGGLFYWFAQAGSQSGDKVASGYKLSNYTFQGFARLFFGANGQTNNGLFYGTQFEIRQNSANSPGATTLYVKHAYAYVSTPTAGRVQFGAGPGPLAKFAAGLFDAFNDGGWNGNISAGNAGANYPWADDEDTIDKIAYFSPTFYGFQFGAAYAPNDAGIENASSCGSASSTCDRLSSSPNPADLSRRRNLIEAGGTYSNTFGPVGLTVEGVYYGSGAIQPNNVPAGTPFVAYSNMNLGTFGTDVTFGGLDVGGNVVFGEGNFSTGDCCGGSSFNPKPKGGSNAVAWLAGAQYTTGPVVFGASFFNVNEQGDYTAPTAEGQETDWGLAAGGTYSVAPGLGFYVNYIYGQRYQGGYDFIDGTAGTANNNVKANLVAIGLFTKW